MKIPRTNEKHEYRDRETQTHQVRLKKNKSTIRYIVEKLKWPEREVRSFTKAQQ